MNRIRYVVVNIIETLLRVLPVPCRVGLRKIGRPDPDSPVFLTCNYHLTVARVKRALANMDGYLLVANSHGHNVWCGATGGHFTNHDVLSILKTSGIDKLVGHRKVILPQLAASGIEAEKIHEKAGWEVIWGPVYAKDIRAFVENNFRKTREMRQVKFPLMQRLEMALMWSFPFSAIVSLIAVFVWPQMLLPLNGLIWGLPLLVFLSFPLYSRWLHPGKRGVGFSKYTVVFDFGRVPLMLFGVFVLFLAGAGLLTHSLTWALALRWGFAAFVIILVLSLDLMGSTPIYKSGLHEDRFLRIVLDEKRCRFAGSCDQVCPRNCYELDAGRRVASLPRAERCVQCGACVVQCPFDALSFVSPKGETLAPATIRTFKLNLLGRRLKR